MQFSAISLLVVLASGAPREECDTVSCMQSAQSSSLVQLKAQKDRKHFQHIDEALNRTETEFVTEVLTSFGKQAPNYTGDQKLKGFRSGSLIDENGMFALDSNVQSVAIDVGAANNPLIFDLDIDANQVVLAFEPVFWDQLAKDMETVAKEVNERGGCETRYEGHCANQRLVVFPSAVSSQIGHAEFHVAANPYCSSLNSVPGGLDPTLVNSTDPEVRDVMASCWGSLAKAEVRKVPTITLASILARIPKHIRIKYLKIDAQGQDYKVLLSAAEQMSRIEYVRFEMQVDPPAGRKMVADIPSYAEVEAKMTELGFVHEPGHACHFDVGASPFSKAIEEKECVFCRELPCKEGGVEPLGPNPRELLQKM